MPILIMPGSRSAYNRIEKKARLYFFSCNIVSCVLSRLLTKDPHQRLGARGAAEVTLIFLFLKD